MIKIIFIINYYILIKGEISLLLRVMKMSTNANNKNKYNKRDSRDFSRVSEWDIDEDDENYFNDDENRYVEDEEEERVGSRVKVDERGFFDFSRKSAPFNRGGNNSDRKIGYEVKDPNKDKKKNGGGGGSWFMFNQADQPLKYWNENTNSNINNKYSSGNNDNYFEDDNNDDNPIMQYDDVDNLSEGINAADILWRMHRYRRK